MRSIHVENGRIVPSEFRGKGFFGSLVHDTSTLSRNLAKNRLQRHLDDYFYIIKCQIAYVNRHGRYTYYLGIQYICSISKD